MTPDFDAVVVGAGAVGLACGYALAQRGQGVLVLEQGNTIGQGVSSRNSEVIHAGLYYTPGSLKARLCVEGRRRLYAFLESRGVDYDACGKLVVAADPGELDALERLSDLADRNEVEGVEPLTPAQVSAMEPALRTAGALWVRPSGVFDSHAYMLALQGGIEDHGGMVALRAPFEGAAPGLDGFSVRVGGAEPTILTARMLVTAAGLGAQGAAARIEGYPANQIPRLHLGKGIYFALHGPAPFRRLVYPIPVPGALGVHYRRDIGGQARFGPDLKYVEAEEYGVGAEEADSFYRAVRRFWPGLPDGSLAPDYAGIRPKIHGADEPQPDFRLDGAEVHGVPGLMALFGIESPGLTSSLAIGEEVADRLLNV